MAILPTIALGITLIAGSNDTIWWRTEGASVVGMHDTKECMLLFLNQDRGVGFTWLHDLKKVSVQDSRLILGDGQVVQMTAQIGTTSLGDFAAVGVPGYAAGIVAQQLEPLLRVADKITIKVDDTELQFAVNRSKMSALLDAVDKCRRQQK